jgi:two-component system LytT family sensor kinase
MNKFPGPVLQYFNIRLLLRLIVWFCVCYLVYGSNIPQDPDIITSVYIFKSISVISLFIFTYVNNLFFVPKYLARKKFGIYFSFAILWMCIYSLGYTLFVKWVIHNYATIKSYDVVFLSIPIDSEFIFSAILDTTIGYATIYGLWLFMSTLTWYMHDYARQQELITKAHQRQMETELSFLKSQLNPHFLFNTLNNLYALALQKSDSAPDAILKLSSILRYLLYESDTPTVSFEKEKEIILAYTELELLRLSEKENLQINLFADKPYIIPPLLWLPVLENVFKHGTRTMSDNHHVRFDFELRNNKLFMYSENKSKPASDVNLTSGGVGLDNLRKRLNLLYPQKHTFEIRQENNSYITTIQIELS